MLLTFEPSLHEGMSPPNVRHPWPATPYTSAPSTITQTKPTSAAPQSGTEPASQRSSPAPKRQTADAPRQSATPAPVNLPPRERIDQPVLMSSLPPPSTHWPNSDESMRQWLSAKAEEDRRRQEEERTRQESLKLDQRKVEQSMLRDSLQAGVPPYMVPFIFASLGGGNMQWAQQYVTQMSQLHSPTNNGYVLHRPQVAKTQPLGAEVPRDNRSIPRNPYAVPRGTSPQSQGSGNRAGSVPLSQTPNVELPQQSSNASAPAPSPSTSGVGSIVAQTQGLAASPKKDAQDQQQQAPIHFYHWVPPSQSQRNAPSGKSPNNSPHASHPHSHLRSAFQNSPKKRKAQGGHQQPPPPPSQLSESTASRARAHTDAGRSGASHSRNRSDASQPNEPPHGPGRNGEPGVIIWQSQKPEPAVNPATSRWYINNLNGNGRHNFEADNRPGHVHSQDDGSRRIPPDPPSRTASSSSVSGSVYREVYRPGHDGSPQTSGPVDMQSTREERRSRSPSAVAMAGMSYDPIRPSLSRLAST